MKMRRIVQWKWNRRFWRVEVDAARFINRQCVSVGISLNWNHRPGVEFDLVWWRVSLEYVPGRRRSL